MSIILGIDTGGTYTDAVVLDVDNQMVLAKAKAYTTYHDLTEGIKNCINNLDFAEFRKITGVSLSTTLATNAIVEGRGFEVGLLLLGEQPTEMIPTKYYKVLSGGHDVKGNATTNIDVEEVLQALNEFKGKVGSVAISGYFSVRNPEHELLLGKMVEEILKVPIVCAHQLTTSLGFYERTVTAVLNAKLIPIITELVQAMKIVMLDMGISAPLMIVKGDGSLMSETVAKQKPIDTILSGPAASIVGGLALTKESEAIIVDMGGTTTDIAIIKDGIPRINPEGASVGGWFTKVEAAEISTHGIGGDSYLQLLKDGKLKIGPQKVIPISMACDTYPYLIEELKLQLNVAWNKSSDQPTDCLILVKNIIPEDLTYTEMKLLELLQEGPHSLVYLFNNLKGKRGIVNYKRLIDHGVLKKISMTPTDILNVKNIYSCGNREGAVLGINILSKRANKNFEEFIDFVMDGMTDKLSLAILESLLNYENGSKKMMENGSSYFMEKIVFSKEKELFRSWVQLKYPIVAIGAPVKAYFPSVCEKLNAKLIIPKDAGVANAIGAATGKVSEKVNIIIKSMPGGGAVMYAPWERMEFDKLEDAKKYALNNGKTHIENAAKRAGSWDYKVLVNEHDHYIRPSSSWNEELHYETLLELTAIGRPKW